MKHTCGCLPYVDADAMLLCSFPVYGTMDAGRGFCVRLNKVARQEGLSQCLLDCARAVLRCRIQQSPGSALGNARR